MNTQVTEQLNIEIQKLKENDYSSYQNFYNQTSGYLYGVIWSIVNNQEAADVIISELYTNIYSSISTELTDNSQFYLWAYNKAQNLTTTYLTTHNVNGDDNSWHKEEAVVAAATNAGMESAADTTGMGMAHQCIMTYS